MRHILTASKDSRGPVADLAYTPIREGGYLAVANATDVIIFKESSPCVFTFLSTKFLYSYFAVQDVWSISQTLPRPSWRQESPVEPRSVHWARAGRTLVVCYLYHGIV